MRPSSKFHQRGLGMPVKVNRVGRNVISSSVVAFEGAKPVARAIEGVPVELAAAEIRRVEPDLPFLRLRAEGEGIIQLEAIHESSPPGLAVELATVGAELFQQRHKRPRWGCVNPGCGRDRGRSATPSHARSERLAVRDASYSASCSGRRVGYYERPIKGSAGLVATGTQGRSRDSAVGGIRPNWRRLLGHSCISSSSACRRRPMAGSSSSATSQLIALGGEQRLQRVVSRGTHRAAGEGRLREGRRPDPASPDDRRRRRRWARW